MVKQLWKSHSVRHSPLHPVCCVWREQLYRSDPDHEWRCGTGEHHAGADLWKVQEKSRQQSYLRRDRHSAVSGADGAVYAAVCNRCIDPVELISGKTSNTIVKQIM